MVERKRLVYRPGRGPSPRNGKTIGHIINFCYKPLEAMPGDSRGNFLNFSVATFVYDNMADVQSELMQQWDVGPVYAIMALIAARVGDLEYRTALNAVLNMAETLT